MKYYLTLSALCLAFVSLAQETVPVEDDTWSMTTKWSLIAVFAAFILILVLRTFRNKPTI